MAVGPVVRGYAVPQGYRLASLMFGAGLIDRTGTLDHGFPAAAADPIPPLPGPHAPRPTIADLCDARGEALVAHARESGRRIRLFWSGGIDSTAAAVSLMKALGDERDRLEVVLNRHSIREYRAFFRDHVRRHRRHRLKRITEAVRPDTINVTGECGDQLFGSAIMSRASVATLAAPWEEGLRTIVRANIFGRRRQRVCFDYLAPVVARCPVPVGNTFTALWWLSFALKWNAVCYRMAARCPLEAWGSLLPSFAHFFRTDAFQVWAMTHPDEKIGDGVHTYKWPLKTYILQYTGDRTYFSTKRKEPSLRGNIAGHAGRNPVGLDAAGRWWAQPYDRSEKPMICLGGETHLWSSLGEGE